VKNRQKRKFGNWRSMGAPKYFLGGNPDIIVTQESTQILIHQTTPSGKRREERKKKEEKKNKTLRTIKANQALRNSYIELWLRHSLQRRLEGCINETNSSDYGTDVVWDQDEDGHEFI
jgi:hypothetical protein